MRLELRSSAPTVCDRCGSHELLKIVRGVGYAVEPLASELGVTTKLPRWAFIRRRMLAKLQEQFQEEQEKLVDGARYPFVAEPSDAEERIQV